MPKKRALTLAPPDQAYGMFVAMVVASLMLLVVCVLSMRLFLRVTDIPQAVHRADRDDLLCDRGLCPQ